MHTCSDALQNLQDRHDLNMQICDDAHHDYDLSMQSCSGADLNMHKCRDAQQDLQAPNLIMDSYNDAPQDQDLSMRICNDVRQDLQSPDLNTHSCNDDHLCHDENITLDDKDIMLAWCTECKVDLSDCDTLDWSEDKAHTLEYRHITSRPRKGSVITGHTGHNGRPVV